MLRHTRRRFQRHRAPWRDGGWNAGLPSRPPFIDSACRYPQFLGQLGARPGDQDSFGYGIGVFHVPHGRTFGSGLQETDSSRHISHHVGMDSDKHDFGRRLILALEAQEQRTGMSRTSAERKRYLHKLMGVTERHAGNYLLGKKLPEPDGLMALAKALGVSWEWLATGRGYMFPVDITPDEAALLMSLSPADRARLFQVGQILFPEDPKPLAA